MNTRMKKKWGITLLVLLCGLVVIAWNADLPPGRFPIWKKAEELPLAREGMDCPELNRGNPVQMTAGDMAWDQITWVVNPADPHYPYGGIFYVDFGRHTSNDQEADEYHTVFQGNMPPVQGRDEMVLRTPAGTFCPVGRYRIRLVNTDNEVVAVEEYTSHCAMTQPVKNAKFNDFPYWEYLGSSAGRVNEDISLTFSALKDPEPEWPEEYVAALEYELVNQKDSYYCCPDCWRIDYLCNGEWYKVASNRICQLMAMQEETVPGLTYVKQWPLECQEVLEHPGTYRLYRKDVGYCEFQVE